MEPHYEDMIQMLGRSMLAASTELEPIDLAEEV